MGDVKTLGLHLRATCTGVVLLIFESIYLRSYISVYTDSLILPRQYYYLCSSKPIEVRVGLLLKCVLRGCTTVTESNVHG